LAERLNAIKESPAHIARLKQFPQPAQDFFEALKYKTQVSPFSGSYIGDTLTGRTASSYLLLEAQKP